MAGLALAPVRYAACAIGATALWLVLMDRVGMAAVGGHVWCGARGIALLLAGHAAPAAVVATVTLIVDALVRRGRWWPRWARGAVLASCFMLPVLGVYLIPVVQGSSARPLTYPVHDLLGATALTALGAAYLAGRDRRYWHYAPWAPISIVAAVTDATMYPGLVAEEHLTTYAVTVMTGTWGVGLPIARLLQGQAGPVGRWVAPVATALALAGSVPLWLWERGSAAAVSPQIERLLRKAPDPNPPPLLAAALAEPLPASSPEARAASFPRGPDRWSVLLVTVDALRADALLDVPHRGFYLEPSDTPFLDRWMESTFRFLDAYSQGNDTIGSFRSMFRGTGAAEWAPGANIPRIGRALDLTTVAVVPPFVLEDWLYGTGLYDFERLDVYDTGRQEQQVELLEKLLPSIAREPFFVWTHFFCTHDPFYTADGAGELSIKNPFEAKRTRYRYRDAVRWFDGQFARLVRVLEASGRKDSTVVVLAADHGEHIGDGLRLGHGDSMHREDIHVPLIVSVPGTSGGIVRGVVGNVDILPTILDLLGGAPEPTHQGQSLLPLMQRSPARSNRRYYIRGYYAGQHALLTDDDLVVYEEQLGAFQRFARERGAEHGRIDAWGRDGAADRAAGAALVRSATFRFRGELESQAARDALHERLGTVGESTSNGDLDFLAEAAGWSPDSVTPHFLNTAIDRAPRLAQKLRIIHRNSWRNEAHWSKILEPLLTVRLRTPEEREALELLAQYSVPLIARDGVRARLDELVGSDDLALIDAWLSLIRIWKTPVEFAGPLARLLAGLERASELNRFRSGALLDAISGLQVPVAERHGEAIETLRLWTRRATADPRTSVAQRACRALGAIGSEDDAVALLGIADGKANAGVRAAALNGFSSLRGAAAVPELKERVHSPGLGVAALTELVRLGDEATVTWLQDGAQTKLDPALREVALDSAKRLTRRLQEN